MAGVVDARWKGNTITLMCAKPPTGNDRETDDMTFSLSHPNAT